MTPYDLSVDWDGYRNYICNSKGEFTCAKDQYVRLNTGWFSDRTACYLAAGRPVITQEDRLYQTLRRQERITLLFDNGGNRRCRCLDPC